MISFRTKLTFMQKFSDHLMVIEMKKSNSKNE